MPEVNPEAAVPKPWVQQAWVKKVGVVLGVLILIWLFVSKSPQPSPQVPKQVQDNNPAGVTPAQIQEEQQQALQAAAQVAAKQKQLEGMKQAAEAATGVKTDDLDLSTSQGQAELKNRMALLQATQLKALQTSQYQTQQPANPQGSGESRTERLRKALMMSSVVYQKAVAVAAQEQPTQAPVSVQPTATPVGTPTVADKHKNLLDLTPTVVSGLTAAGAYRVLPQGTVVEAVLTNKLVGTADGPVNVMLTTPLYAPGTHEVLFPPGTRILGEAASTGGFGDSRLAVAFHRAIAGAGPTLYSVSLDTMPGLDQQGAVALKDKVNAHVLSTIAISGVIGAIGGLSNIGNYSSGSGYGGMQQFQAGVSQTTSQSAMQVLNRFINRKPDIEIRPGTRVKLIWAGDQSLPVFGDTIQALQESQNADSRN